MDPRLFRRLAASKTDSSLANSSSIEIARAINAFKGLVVDRKCPSENLKRNLQK
jgi:hypothetical protein